jgi:hypothetical protein
MFKPQLRRFEDKIQNMLHDIECTLGDVAVIDGKRVAGNLNIEYGRQISLGGARTTKPTRITTFRFRKCLLKHYRCGSTVYINNIFYKVKEGGIQESACGHVTLYLADCEECSDGN